MSNIKIINKILEEINYYDFTNINELNNFYDNYISDICKKYSIDDFIQINYNINRHNINRNDIFHAHCFLNINFYNKNLHPIFYNIDYQDIDNLIFIINKKLNILHKIFLSIHEKIKQDYYENNKRQRIK